jgi:hypothetical protein
MMAGSVWLTIQSGETIVNATMAGAFIWGLVIFVRALGPLLGENTGQTSSMP